MIYNMMQYYQHSITTIIITMFKYFSLVNILNRLIDLTFLFMAIILVFPLTIIRAIAKIFNQSSLHLNPFKNTPLSVFKSKCTFNAISADIVKNNGFIIRDYQCFTEDHVSVSFWRIVPDQQIQEGRDTNNQNLKPISPVLIQHGLLDCSMTWFLLQKSSDCLPFKLAELGYDVWVSNNRGTKYSDLKNRKQEQYWQYTLDHIVKYDVPSIINYIIKQTKTQKLIYIGHSQGTTQFLTALDVHPDLGSKISCFIGLGPVISLRNAQNHLCLKLLASLHVCQILKFLGFKTLLTFPPWMNRLVGFMISNSCIFYRLCKNIVCWICGFNKQQNKVHPSRFSIILSHQPGGSSTNNVIHWIQIFRHGYIKKFDYGSKKNKQIYGSVTPPSYSYNSLKSMQFQFHLFRGTSDHLISDKDFQYLTQKLPQQKFKVYSVEDFAHLDYLWAQQAPSLIYDQIVNILHSKKQTQQYDDFQQTKDMTENNSYQSQNTPSFSFPD